MHNEKLESFVQIKNYFTFYISRPYETWGGIRFFGNDVLVQSGGYRMKDADNLNKKIKAT